MVKKMDKNYLSHVAETKNIFHKDRAKIPFEEKIRIIIALQKIESEFIKKNKGRKTNDKYRKVWEIEL